MYEDGKALTHSKAKVCYKYVGASSLISSECLTYVARRCPKSHTIDIHDTLEILKNQFVLISPFILHLLQMRQCELSLLPYIVIRRSRRHDYALRFIPNWR